VYHEEISQNEFDSKNHKNGFKISFFWKSRTNTKIQRKLLVNCKTLCSFLEMDVFKIEIILPKKLYFDFSLVGTNLKTLFLTKKHIELD